MNAKAKKQKTVQKAVVIDPDKHKLLKEVSTILYNSPLSTAAGICINVAYNLLMSDPEQFSRFNKLQLNQN